MSLFMDVAMQVMHNVLVFSLFQLVKRCQYSDARILAYIALEIMLN